MISIRCVGDLVISMLRSSPFSPLTMRVPSKFTNAGSRAKNASDHVGLGHQTRGCTRQEPTHIFMEVQTGDINIRIGLKFIIHLHRYKRVLRVRVGVIVE